MDKYIKRQKWVEGQPIGVGVDAGEETFDKNLIEKGVIYTRQKSYRPPLPSTYKEMEISDDLNDVMEWVFRDYKRSLKQEKYHLPPRDDVMEFDVQTDTKEL